MRACFRSAVRRRRRPPGPCREGLFHDNRFSATPLSDRPDLVKLADAYGCLGLRATTVEELDQVIDQALANKAGPTIVDVRVRRQEKVFPMVPAGAPLNDMIDGE